MSAKMTEDARRMLVIVAVLGGKDSRPVSRNVLMSIGQWALAMPADLFDATWGRSARDLSVAWSAS